MMRPIARAAIHIVLGGLVGSALVATGCAKTAINIHDRPCDAENACAEEFSCDEASGKCITVGDVCAADALPSPCRYGEDTCAEGCRVCEAGTWSECRMDLPQACLAGTIYCANNEWIRCDSWAAIAQRVACDDGKECTVDSCSPTRGCQYTPRPAGTPCAGNDSDECTSTCDGAGVCQMSAPVDCGDDGHDCTDDRCVGPGTCPHTRYLSGDLFPCRPARSICDFDEVCDGASDDCPSDSVEVQGTSCGSTQNTDCSAPDVCDGAGLCDPMTATDGTACADCPGGGLCDSGGCSLGACIACDGTNASAPCTIDNDCGGCDSPCTIGTCLELEQFACADSKGSSPLWANGAPCEDVVCGSQRAGYDWPGAVGTDCAADGGGSSGAIKRSRIVYTFNTVSPAMAFNIWMRNLADQDHSSSESYDCSVTGTDSGTYSFTFVEADSTTRYGPGCDPIGGGDGWYCWMAADGDTSSGNGYQPVILDPGEHVLTCEITTNDGTDDKAPSGFDGIIITNDLHYIPDEQKDGSAVCGSSTNSDAEFTAGNCTPTNWPGQDLPGTSGWCDWRRRPIGWDCGSACPRTTGCVCDGAAPPSCVN